MSADAELGAQPLAGSRSRAHRCRVDAVDEDLVALAPRGPHRLLDLVRHRPVVGVEW